MDTIKKWLSDLKSEVPTFMQLCKTLVQLLKKEEPAPTKAEVADLFKRSRKMQIVIGVGVLVSLFFMMRGCGRNQTSGYVTHADADMRKAILAQVEQERQRLEKAEIEQREAEAKRAAEEARREAVDKAKRQKHEELGGWYHAERRKLEEQKKADEDEIEKSRYDRAHDILVAKGWPQIGFPGIDGISLAEPLPEKYSDYVNLDCPITIKDVPLFTSMRIEGVQHRGAGEPAGLNGIVSTIRLEGKVRLTAEQTAGWIDTLSRRLDESWKVVHTCLDKSLIVWEGLPKWRAYLECPFDATKDNGGLKRFVLVITSEGDGLRSAVDRQLENERRNNLQRIENDFKKNMEALEDEFHRRQDAIK